MNFYKNENSLLKKTNSKKNKITNLSLINLKLIHNIVDSLNISLLVLILTLSYISISSQREWSDIYSYLSKKRAINSNLIDYISKTEQFYINEFETLKTLKKTTPKDLIYLEKQVSRKKKNELRKKIKYIYDGLKNSHFQMGY